MRKHLYIIIATCLVILLLQCCQKVPNKEYLAEAELLLNTEPDSADAKLNLINIKRLKGEDWAKYALLRTMVDVKQGKGIPNDRLIRTAYNYYADKSKHGESSYLNDVRYFVQASIYMGDWYASQDSIKQCEAAYRTAIKYAEKCGDCHSEYCTLSRLSRRKAFANNAEEALILIEDALRAYDKCKDSDENYLSLLNDAANRAFVLANSTDKNYRRAFKYVDEEFKFAQTHNMPEGINQCHVCYACFYYWTKDYPAALEHAKLIVVTDEDSEVSNTRRQIIAGCYMECDSVAQAIATYRKTLRSMNLDSRYIAYRNLGDLMLQVNEKDTAASYYNAAFECEEQMYLSALKTKEDYYKEVMTQEKAKEKLKYRSKLRTRTLAGSLIFLLLIAFLVFRYLTAQLRLHQERRRNAIWARKHDQEKHMMEKKHFEKETQFLQNEKQHLQNEKQLLSEKVMQKDAMVRFLQGYIIERNEIVKKINAKKDSHISLMRKDWLDIERILNEIDDQSIAKVRAKMKNLSEEDIRLCILARLRMSNPAIGCIYGISVSAVQHRKQKLKKDGFGINDPSRTLEQVIISI